MIKKIITNSLVPLNNELLLHLLYLKANNKVAIILTMAALFFIYPVNALSISTGNVIVGFNDDQMLKVVISNISSDGIISGSCECDETDPLSIHTDNSQKPTTMINFPYGLNVSGKIASHYNSTIDFSTQNNIFFYNGNLYSRNGLNISFAPDGYPIFYTSWYSGLIYRSPIVIINSSHSALIISPTSGSVSTFRHSSTSGFTSIGTSVQEAPLLISANSTVTREMLKLDQNDEDQPFIDYDGKTARNVAYNICRGGSGSQTWCMVQLEGYIKNQVNNSNVWIPYYIEIPPEP
jgi:hypothetical protein